MRPLIPYFIQEQYLEGKTTGVISGYTIFVDMSGFTQLTAALMNQGKEGAEKLSIILNDVFGPMVNCVYEHGGRIPYFAGDAFTAVFEGERTEEYALEILETAQSLLLRLEETQEKITEFHIGVKIGIGYGAINWGIVGGEQKAFYFNGSAIDDCINSQKKAQEGEVIFTDQFRSIFSANRGWERLTDNNFYKLTATIKTKTNLFQPMPSEGVIENIARKFLPDSVMNFNQQGEFRTVISVFISFDGAKNHQDFNDFVTVVLTNMIQFSGYFKEVDYGDKGGILLGFFGAPVSFENNVERALEFLLVIEEELAQIKAKTGIRYRAGVTSGIAYAGIVGGEERSQYAAVGNNVNLAARLMTFADWGEVMVDSVVQKDEKFNFKYRGEIDYKGFDRPIPTYKLEGRNEEQKQAYEGTMVGRNAEIEELTSFALKAFTQKTRIAYVFGEAGIGKSRLTYELQKNLKRKAHFKWLICRSDQILQKPFNPFIFFLKDYFNQSAENTPERNLKNFQDQFLRLRSKVQGVTHERAVFALRELRRTRPVLEALLSLETENLLWNDLDAKGRFQNTIAAFSVLFVAESLVQPVVLELEDGHWFDDNSKAFLEEFIGRTRLLQIFILVTSRYNDEGQKTRLFKLNILDKYHVPFLELDLNTLDAEGMRDFAENRLNGKIHEDLQALLKRTTNGNPFYLEQMLEYFIESNLLIQQRGLWNIKDKNVKISNSINAVLTARIDRLSNLVKETVKTAAVIGREFEIPVLREVMLAQSKQFKLNGISNDVLTEQIKSAEKGQIWQAMNELRYIFRHSLLREAVYEMQLRARVRELHHLIGEAIEKVYSKNLEPKFVDLAFHYEQAEVEPKMLEYLEKAADLTRDLYQNQQALRYFEKLLELQINHKKRYGIIETLLKKGSILQLIGRWKEAEKTFDEALTKARQTDSTKLIGKTNNALGQLLLLQGNYEDANMYLEAAAAFFESIEHQKGIAKVYGDLGNLYFRQGNYEDAKSHFIRSIQLSELYEHNNANAQIVANLGLTYMNLGKYDDGIQWQQSQLEICKQVHDRQGMATLYVNMGIVYFESAAYDNALTCFEKGLKLSEELGNKLLVSIAMGSLGRVYERKGNYDRAMELFEEDLKITEELGDKQGISIALGLIGELKGVLGDFEAARRFIEKNLAISRELGYQKGVAKALNLLGDFYFAQKDFENAATHYEEAIKITREIKQPLVLTSSLIEQGETMVQLNRIKEAAQLLREAKKMANDLGNSDLIFETKILEAHVQSHKENKDETTAILINLLDGKLEEQQEAEVQFELYRLVGSEAGQKKALEIYRKLYAETPQFLFKERMEQLAVTKKFN